MRGGGAMKKPGQSWADYWNEERINEAKRRYNVMMADRKKKVKKVSKKAPKKGGAKKKVKKQRKK